MGTPKEFCPNCKQLVDVVETKSFGNQISKTYSCGDSSIDITLIIPNPTLGTKVKDQKGKILSKSKIECKVEKRFSMTPSKAIQIVTVKGEIVHIHCKAEDCGNEWKIKEGNGWDSKFKVEGGQSTTRTVTCNKCSRSYRNI